MADISKEELRGLLNKYRGRMEKQLNITIKKDQKPVFSREYQQFKKEFMPRQFTFYEKLCNVSEKIIKIKPKPESEKKLQSFIDISHLNITPTGVISFSILGPLTFIILSIIISLLISQGLFFIVVSLFVGLILIGILST